MKRVFAHISFCDYFISLLRRFYCLVNKLRFLYLVLPHLPLLWLLPAPPVPTLAAERSLSACLPARSAVLFCFQRFFPRLCHQSLVLLRSQVDMRCSHTPRGSWDIAARWHGCFTGARVPCPSADFLAHSLLGDELVMAC